MMSTVLFALIFLCGLVQAAVFAASSRLRALEASILHSFLAVSDTSFGHNMAPAELWTAKIPMTVETAYLDDLSICPCSKVPSARDVERHCTKFLAADAEERVNMILMWATVWPQM